ncbi:MAG: response regulator [Alphaproteobacteria bacterium]|nr:response regulator [Alphaproteobacteria bacterium]
MRRLKSTKSWILLADSGTFHARLLTSVLSETPFSKIDLAHSSEEAWRFVCERPYDAILLDQSLEPMNGLSFARRIRQTKTTQNRFCPIIMMAGHPTMTLVSRARDVGVTEFLAKPVSQRAVVERLEAALRNPRTFVQAGDFFGPDRRRRAEDYFGPERRQRRGREVEVDGLTGAPV